VPVFGQEVLNAYVFLLQPSGPGKPHFSFIVEQVGTERSKGVGGFFDREDSLKSSICHPERYTSASCKEIDEGQR
jgi:hypothetical protein